MPICLLANISGRVQGVFFRASTKQQADKLHLTGYAKNLSNGDVEVVICGEPDSMTSMIAWLHHGPRLAKVKQLTTREIPILKTADFSIL